MVWAGNVGASLMTGEQQDCDHELRAAIRIAEHLIGDLFRIRVMTTEQKRSMCRTLKALRESILELLGSPLK